MEDFAYENARDLPRYTVTDFNRNKYLGVDGNPQIEAESAFVLTCVESYLSEGIARIQCQRNGLFAVIEPCTPGWLSTRFYFSL